MWKNDYRYTPYSQPFDVPDGTHQMKVVSVKDVVSAKTRKNMIEVHCSVEGSNGVEWVERIVEGEYFDANMSKFFDAFGIQPGNFGYMTWIGRTAAAQFSHRDEEFTDSSGIQRSVNRAYREKFIIQNQMRFAPPPQNGAYQQQGAQQPQQFPENIPF